MFLGKTVNPYHVHTTFGAVRPNALGYGMENYELIKGPYTKSDRILVPVDVTKRGPDYYDFSEDDEDGLYVTCNI